MCLFPADDMGLGKTLTMIALILAQKQLKTEKRKEKLEMWLSKNGTELFPLYSTYIMMQCHLKCLKCYSVIACKTTDSICAHFSSVKNYTGLNIYCTPLQGPSVDQCHLFFHWMCRISQVITLYCSGIYFFIY